MKKIFPIGSIILLVAVAGYYYSTQNHAMQPISHEGMMGKPVAQSHRSYSLHLTSQTKSLQPNQQTTVTYTITDEKGKVIKDFLFDHTKLMHFILARHDLQDFQHLHPNFDKNTGVFSVPVTFPDNGTYRLFADFIPAETEKEDKGNALSVIPYQDVQIGKSTSSVPIALDSATTKTVGMYTITYKIPKEITTNTQTTILLHVSQNGQPITQFDTYLGAKAHGILIKKDTFDFVHLHDMESMQKNAMMGNENMHEMNPQNNNADISFTYIFPSSGIYKLFSQFQIQGQVITTNYTFAVK
jgi:hypothetical protein